jgi:hypothetical protein
VLFTGNPWRALGRARPEPSVVRGHWRAWMLDGRWVDFWVAYVSLLTAGERERWLAALSRPAMGGDPARRTWRLVSARLLADRA